MTISSAVDHGKCLPAVALIGCGAWGKNLARNLASLGVLDTLCDTNISVTKALQAQYPTARATSDVRVVLTDEAVQACVIATPAASHFELARQALESGKDVFVEKPLALTVKEGEALVELAASRNHILMVGHLLEYHPAVERLCEIVTRGELGKIQYVYSNRLNLGRIRTAESALWSFAPHDIHVLLRLLGEQPVEVVCQGGSYLSNAVADVTMSIFRFASGVRSHIFVSWLHPYKEQKLIVVGDRKMIVFDDTRDIDKLVLYPHRVDWIERVPVAVKVKGEAMALPEVEPLEAECRHFVECVRTRQKPRTDGINGVNVLRVLEACQRSLELGGGPVSMSSMSEDVQRGHFAHSTAIIEVGAQIGNGTQIWRFSHVMPRAKIGQDCSLGQNVFVGNNVVIGNNVKIQNNVSVYEGVVLEDNVFCGPAMVFTNVINPRSHIPRKSEFLPTLVQRGATIGANATVICGHSIGRYAFVGAGAVVTRDIPDHALVLGAPARIVGWMCMCGVRLPMGTGKRQETRFCPTCGQKYVRKGQRVELVPVGD